MSCASDTLYPSETLYPGGCILLPVSMTSETSEIYDISDTQKDIYKIVTTEE